MPTLFFEDTDPHQKIRFDTFGHSKTMKPVRTKAINDISFLTPPNANFDARRPAYREDEQYGEHKVDPLIFTHQQKMSLRNATALALKIVDDGYEALCNYLRFKHDPDNAHVLKFNIRMKMWLGVTRFPEPINVVTSAMREMQDKLQAPETFITFVNMENQRDIQCERFATIHRRQDIQDGLVHTQFTNFKNFMITIPSKTDTARVRDGCGTGIRIYVEDLFGTYHINKCASIIIHELSHKILGTNDHLIDGSAIYGAKACKALAAKAHNNAMTIADNWAMFYMSFGCYPGQEEYACQAEYEIKTCDKGYKRSRIFNKFNISKKCQTIEEIDAIDAIAARNEPAQVSELRAYNAHISRRVYLDKLASCGKLGDKNQSYQAQKELSCLKARMEYRESLTNIANKTDEEVNELKKQVQEIAPLKAEDSRDAMARRQRLDPTGIEARMILMKRWAAGEQARKELREQMEDRESLTNIGTEIDEEVNELQKQIQCLADFKA